MTKKAFVIGINYVGTRSELSGCVRDALRIIAVLKSHYGYKAENIRFLADNLDKNVDAKSLSQANQPCYGKPTRVNIIEGMKWLAAGAAEGDTLYIHYSGHGTWMRDTNGDERDGRDEALCPLDCETAGMLVDDDIRKILVEPLPKGCKLRGVLDCCHSGTAMDLPELVRMRGDSERDVALERTGERVVAASVAIFSGCRDSQTSADAWFGGQAMGAMTYGFTKALKRWHDIYDGDEEEPTFKKLLSLSRKFMRQNNFTQVPQLNTSQAFDMNMRFDI